MALTVLSRTLFTPVTQQWKRRGAAAELKQRRVMLTFCDDLGIYLDLDNGARSWLLSCKYLWTLILYK